MQCLILLKKRTNNVIDSIKFVLNYAAFDKNTCYSDSDSKQNSYDSEFSDTEES